MSVWRAELEEEPTEFRQGQRRQALGRAPVPIRALLLSAAALALPLVAQIYTPDLVDDQLGMLLWLPSLVPAFLLTYYRGWRGAAIAIAAGMAVITLTEVALAARGRGAPDWPVLLALVAMWMSVSLGIGWVGELLHRARLEAEESALVDAGTGLPNRRHLAVFLEAAFAAAERGGRMAVVLCDVDGFRRLSESHGQAAADQTIDLIARVLAQRTRRLDLTASLGRDQFVTVLTGATTGDALQFAEEVQRSLADERLPWSEMTMSAGVASYARGLASPEALLAEADRGLWRARAAGAGAVGVWEPEPRGRHLLAVSEMEGGDGGGAAPPSPPPREPGGERVRGRVLIVDDDRRALERAAGFARHLGFHVDTMEDAGESLARVGGRPPDVILSGLVMAGMCGFTLADRVAEEWPGLPVLLSSVYDHQALSEDRRPAAVVGFVRKPIELRELGVALEQALAGVRSNRRLA